MVLRVGQIGDRARHDGGGRDEGDLLDSEKIKFLCTAALACRQRETSVLTSAPWAAHCEEECKEQ